MDPRKGERAMLVKDAEDDYAVIVGRWEVQRKRTLQRCASKILPVDIIHLRAAMIFLSVTQLSRFYQCRNYNAILS